MKPFDGVCTFEPAPEEFSTIFDDVIVHIDQNIGFDDVLHDCGIHNKRLRLFESILDAVLFSFAITHATENSFNPKCLPATPVTEPMFKTATEHRQTLFTLARLPECGVA